MTDKEKGDVEILVHVSAPSRGQDDVRYRALAQAFLDFEPGRCRRMDEESENQPEEQLDHLAETQLQEELMHSTQEERESEKSYRPDNDDEGEHDIPFICSQQNLSQISLSQGMLSPALSFEGVFDNADSPVFRGHITWKQSSSQGQSQVSNSTDWKTPPSVIADSQPDNRRAILAFSSPTRVLELYLQNIESPGRSSNATTRRSQSTTEARGEISSPKSQSTQSHDSRGGRTPAGSEIRSSPPSMTGQALRGPRQNTSSPVFGSPLRRSQAHDEAHLKSSFGKQQSQPRSSQINDRDVSTNHKAHGHNLRSRSQYITSSPISFGSSLREVQATAEAQLESPSGKSQSELRSQVNETVVSTNAVIQGHSLQSHSQNITSRHLRSSLRFSQDTTKVNTHPSSEDRQDQAELPQGKKSTRAKKQSPPPNTTGRILRNRYQNTTSSPILRPSLNRTRIEASSSPNIASTAPVKIPEASIPETSRPQKRQCTEVEIIQGSRSKSSSFDGITTSSQATSLSPSRIETASPLLEIHAPVPATSTTDLKPTSLLTPPLIALSEKMPLCKLFRPSLQTRELRPLERGYWAIDSSSWDMELQKRFWYLLYDFIGRGAAGWGVWCTRNEDFMGFRVFCWGGIVEYIYLFLYMASASKIKGKGATWISGDGEVVIKIPC